MGGVLSTANAWRNRGADIELSGSYERFGQPDGDVAWTLEHRGAGYQDWTHALAALMGENGTNRCLTVRNGTPAEQDIRQAFGGLPHDVRQAWSDIMIHGLQREGAEHFATLVSHRAIDLNHPENLHASLLHQLAREGSNAPGSTFSLAERFALLRDAGVDLDLSCGGTTALHAAAEAGNLDAVEGLLAAGAHPELRDANGHTPLALAQLRQNNDLEQAGQPHADQIANRLSAAPTPGAQNLGASVLSRAEKDLPQVLTAGAMVMSLAGMAYSAANLVSGGGRKIAANLARAGIQQSEATEARDQRLAEYVGNLTATTLGPENQTMALDEAEIDLRYCASLHMNDTLADLFPNPLPPMDNDQSVNKTVGSPGGGHSTQPLQQPGAEDSRVGIPELNKTSPGRNASIGAPPHHTLPEVPSTDRFLPNGTTEIVPPIGEPDFPYFVDTDHPCRDSFIEYRLLMQSANNRALAGQFRQIEQSSHLSSGRENLANSALLGGSSLLAIGTLMAHWLRKRAEARTPVQNA